MTNYLSWFVTRLEIGRGGQNNIHCLEGLRGFAVGLVFFVHYIVLGSAAIHDGTWTYRIASVLHYWGHTGVDLFFVLSGFLIYGTLIHKPKTTLSYYIRRIERIYPTYLIALSAYVILSFFFPAQSKFPDDPLRALIYLVQNIFLLSGVFPITPIIAVTWSLSYEMLYYLSIPLVISVFRLRSRSPKTRLYFFLIVSVGFILYCALFGGLVRFAMFGAGIILYELFSNLDLRKFPNGAGILAWITGMIIILFIPQQKMGIFIMQSDLWAAVRTAILFVALSLLCMDCISNQQHLTSRIFTYTPLRYFGNISYSYFLIHGLTLKAYFLIVGSIIPIETLGPVGFWIGMPISFSLTIIVALILYLSVEYPLSISPALIRKPRPLSVTGPNSG
jgi:exopolysaccharide production protein ExoZ